MTSTEYTNERPVSSYSISPPKKRVEQIPESGEEVEEGTRAEVCLSNDSVFKDTYVPSDAGYVIEKLNKLNEAEIPFPHHEIHEEDGGNVDEIDSVIVRCPRGKRMSDIEDVSDYLAEIHQYCLKAARNGFRIDPRPSNWAVYDGGVAYIDTTDSSSIKEDSRPERWMAKFISNGMEEVADALEDESVEGFEKIAQDLKNRA